MREIVLDTETTGLDPKAGHKLVEIGCLELINHIPTGGKLHLYINPEREMDPGAFEIHGLSTEFLAKYKPFRDHADEILSFLGESTLIIHNASFDSKFLNIHKGGHIKVLLSWRVNTKSELPRGALLAEMHSADPQNLIQFMLA